MDIEWCEPELGSFIKHNGFTFGIEESIGLINVKRGLRGKDTSWLMLVEGTVVA